MYRTLSTRLKKKASDNKVVVLVGARQTGKTTLLKNSFPKAAYINLEKSDYINVFNSRDLEKIKSVVNQEKKGTGKLLILDEIQRLDDPGMIAKLIHDELKNIRLIISGSSALEIANKASESLAGRKHLIQMYPLTFQEKLIQTNKIAQARQKKGLILAKAGKTPFKDEILESMRYGMYPELLNIQNKEDHLLELVDATILKDVFYLNLVKDTKNLLSILKLLAYQIGQQVNVTDLASRVGIARTTVVQYLEILKKIYVVYTLPPFTKKRRDEVGKTEKIYFWDLGIRNAIVNDFSPVVYRRDYGNILENFAITEIIKISSYNNLRYTFNYWKTKWGSEVDLIAHKDQQIIATEIKSRSGKITSAFKNTYSQAKTQIITMDNLADLLV